MQAVNLLPAYARPAGRWASVGKELSPARVVRIGGIVAVAAAVIVGALYFYERSVVSDRHATLEDAKARLAAVEATAAPLRAAQSETSARQLVIQSVVSQRVVWEKVLRDLGAVLPDQVFLSNLQVAPPAAAPPPDTSGGTATSSSSALSTTTSSAAVGTSFTLTGSASSHVRVALVLDRLALLPWLSGVTLQSSTHGQGAAGTSSAGDQFQIMATFNQTGVTG
jgi:Tfp pilus assembly protein PilN